MNGAITTTSNHTHEYSAVVVVTGGHAIQNLLCPKTILIVGVGIVVELVLVGMVVVPRELFSAPCKRF
ncbi:MAG: hypothetical protein IJC05_00045 [Phascolarctobacterium sp.]|nr:hypothetical protein [Phascolarctobacterium sp.]